MSCSVTMYGGSRRITVVAVRLTSRPRSSAAVDQRRRVRREFDAGHQSRAAHVHDRRMTRPQAPRRPANRCADTPAHVTPAGRGRARRARRAPRGTPAGCRRTSCRDRRPKSVAATVPEIIAAPTGMPPPSALPSATRSGVRPIAGEYEELSGSAGSALHFVRDEQRARSRARVGDRLRRSRRKSAARRPRPESGSTMIAAVVASTSDRSVAGSDASRERHAGNQRLERLAVVLVPRHRQRAHRPAVERVRERDELRARRLAARVPEAARELQARFDRFGAAVAEERALEPGERGQPRRQLALQRMKVQVRRVRQRRRLLAERARQSRMPVAERRHADARDEVEVRAALFVEQARAGAALEHHGQALVGLQHVLRFEGLDVRLWSSSSLPASDRRT